MARVVVIGPNLLDQSTGSFHVHAEGCADIKRSPVYRSREFAADKKNIMEFSSEKELVESIYADFMDEGTADDFLNDFHFFPCVRFTTEKEAPMDTKTVTTLRKITFELVKNGMFFDMEIFVPKNDFAEALSEIFAMRTSRNIQY